MTTEQPSDFPMSEIIVAAAAFHAVGVGSTGTAFRTGERAILVTVTGQDVGTKEPALASFIIGLDAVDVLLAQLTATRERVIHTNRNPS